MKFFLPDWEDRVDPNFDFKYDRYSEGHNEDPYSNDVYAHQIYESSLPYDGILTSLSIFQSKIVLKNHGSNDISIRGLRNIKEYLKIPKRSALEVLGDCGAFSYVNEKNPPPFFSTENVANIYDRLGFDYGVSVDHMAIDYYITKDKISKKRIKTELDGPEKERRVKITIENAQKFLEIYKEKQYKFIPIGAAQGFDRESYAYSVKKLVAMGYTYIGLGSLVRYSSKEILSILERIKPELENAKLHLFGVLRPQFLKKFEGLGVVSFDSASYLRKAWLRSGQNYLTKDNKWYAAVRVPYSDNETLLKNSGLLGIRERELTKMEKKALLNLKNYDEGKIDLNETLRTVMEYDDLLIRNSNDGINLRERYERTLRDKPWKKCKCKVCREMGIEVVIFRGSNRNKRRGFHNSWVFKQELSNEKYTHFKVRGKPKSVSKY
ncbi:MAG: tRNA-guanine transglycosylase DpdA [Thermoplasmatales archaeon]